MSPAAVAGLSVLRALADRATSPADWADSRALATAIAGPCPEFAAEAARINAAVMTRLERSKR